MNGYLWLALACSALFAIGWLPLFFGPFSMGAPVSPVQWLISRRRRPRPPNERAGREPHPWAAKPILDWGMWNWALLPSILVGRGTGCAWGYVFWLRGRLGVSLRWGS